MTDRRPFEPRLEPLAHQSAVLRDHGHKVGYGLLWEQGTGKTKSLMDNFGYLWSAGKVDTALVIAPNGVHHNWVVEEIPKHWPSKTARMRAFEWDTNKAGNKSFGRAFDAFLEESVAPGTVGFLCMSYDGIMTDRGRDATWQLMRTRRTFYALDESQRAKDPSTSRTKRILASGKYATYRRIASGTPADKPFDVYSQMRFLDPDFWVRELGIGSFTAFKNWFGVWEQRMLAGGRSFPDLVGYRDLPQLNAALGHITSRVLKSEVLDLPPKVYKRAFHPLSPKQRDAYESLKKEAMVLLESGDLISPTNALVLQLRLTQVACGFIKSSPEGPEIPLGDNPRTRLLTELLTDLEGRPAIIWGAYRHDAEQAALASRKAGRRFVAFDSARPAETIEAWKAGEYDDLFGNLGSTMTEGYTLNRAADVFYYSRTPRLIARLQSEDRCHRLGQTSSVTYTDLLAEQTQDARQLENLRKKRDMVGGVLGDSQEELRSWLRYVVEGGDDDQ